MKPNSILKILVFLALLSCKKDQLESAIPYRQVNLLVYPNTPEYFDISSPGGHVYVNGGYRGILIYRYTQDEFRVFDRACTYDPDDPCGRVHFEMQGDVLVQDTCCGSTFQVIDGTVTEGPAAQALRPYQYNWDGNTLHIFN